MIFLTSILPYVSFFIFVNGLGYKIYKWTSTPKASGHFSIYSSNGHGNTGLNIFQDLVLFPRMLRKEKTLWIASWLFHLSVIVSVINHYKVFLPYNNFINGLIVCSLQKELLWCPTEEQARSVIIACGPGLEGSAHDLVGNVFIFPIALCYLRRP